jgi:hypothetical protein
MHPTLAGTFGEPTSVRGRREGARRRVGRGRHIEYAALLFTSIDDAIDALTVAMGAD